MKLAKMCVCFLFLLVNRSKEDALLSFIDLMMQTCGRYVAWWESTIRLVRPMVTKRPSCHETYAVGARVHRRVRLESCLLECK